MHLGLLSSERVCTLHYAEYGIKQYWGIGCLLTIVVNHWAMSPAGRQYWQVLTQIVVCTSPLPICNTQHLSIATDNCHSSAQETSAVSASWRTTTSTSFINDQWTWAIHGSDIDGVMVSRHGTKGQRAKGHDHWVQNGRQSRTDQFRGWSTEGVGQAEEDWPLPLRRLLAKLRDARPIKSRFSQSQNAPKLAFLSLKSKNTGEGAALSPYSSPVGRGGTPPHTPPPLRLDPHAYGARLD